MVYHFINRSAELDNMCMNEQQNTNPLMLTYIFLKQINLLLCCCCVLVLVYNTDVDLYIPQTDQSIIMLLLCFGVGV